MDINPHLQQTPAPGEHRLAFCGDLLEVTLRLSAPRRGAARLRTNIGHAGTARREIIREAAARQKRLAEDWHDLPMTPAGEGRYRLTLPLVESGHFEAKALFLPEGESRPLWPEGPNTVINVHPAWACAANSLYNAFVRQFGDERRPPPRPAPAPAEALRALEAEGYAVIPPSGTFRDLVRRLDLIVGRLRCRTLLLLPIHPTPTVYGRMGRFGSPYAALDFLDVDPALADFDPKATPLEQFGELVDAVHARGARLFLDIAIHHTGWAAKLHGEHPDWLRRDPDGTIRSPGAWGVVWRDLAELDLQRPALWRYLARVFLTWCRRGVDGFRCDAGYMIPAPAWEFIVAVVRREFPDTLFLLEGLGGPLEATRTLLNAANLDLAYSELFQTYDRRQMEAYLPGALQLADEDGLLMHFAETHDNPRLAARSLPYARLRTALSALCSTHGAFAFANGVEWHAAEKIDVHGRAALAWGRPDNQVDRIARLNALLESHPAFFPGARVQLVQQGPGNSLALRRQPADPAAAPLLALVNLDDSAPQPVAWPPAAADPGAGPWTDLLTGRAVAPMTRHGLAGLDLAPAEVLCLTPERRDWDRLLAVERVPCNAPAARVTCQRMRAKALEVRVACRGLANGDAPDADRLAADLAADPRGFCRRQDLPGAVPRVVAWEWPRDLRREVMVPPRHFLCLRAPAPFRARLEPDGGEHPLPEAPDSALARQEDSLPAADGSHFVLLAPAAPVPTPRAVRLRVEVHDPAGVRRGVAPLLMLPAGDGPRVPRVFPHRKFLDAHPIVLSANRRGGMLRAGAAWSELRSRYDALLAANLAADVPEDRRILLTRCRAWLVFQGYSQDLVMDRLQSFQLLPNGGRWRFRVPFGFGQTVGLDLEAEMLPDRNAVRLVFCRRPRTRAAAELADDQSVQLILRPDIEDRSFHDDTKAYLGPERAWPAAVRAEPAGFVFAPDSARSLRVEVSAGRFQPEPEWQYLVHHPVEAGRGLPAESDLFSPGYFIGPLAGGGAITLLAQALTPAEPEPLPVAGHAVRAAPAGGPDRACASMPLAEALARAMDAFVVRRGAGLSVIAGYPWFLDWGRDTLIAVRGLAAAGRAAAVESILLQFAALERDGTLPNVLSGHADGNRDTSDAPLWFCVAVADACRAAGAATRLLAARAGGRTLRQVLLSIAEHYRRGTPNGIRMDPGSGLIFSPAHFTWMDTNHPAATPREGYPIEIQALWHAALAFLADHDARGPWRDLAARVQEAIRRRFWLEPAGYLSDCLHARPGQAAADAEPDDALRPNQLLAVTLGALPDPGPGARLLDACAELLVPGAVRSLADRPVARPLPVARDGRLLNDPLRPYWGRYEGDEDTRRKPAYHNGTAWTWLFPSYAEAWVRVHGPAARDAARAWLGSSALLMTGGCLGQLPELRDGDAPHAPRGCDAQAWAVTECYRVLAGMR